MSVVRLLSFLTPLPFRKVFVRGVSHIRVRMAFSRNIRADSIEIIVHKNPPYPAFSSSALNV